MIDKIYSKKIVLLIACLLLLIHACKESASGPESDIPPTGNLQLIVTTEGPDQDRDGYLINIDGEIELESSINDTLLFEDVEQGDHQLELEDLDNACSVTAANPRTVSITVQDTTSAVIEVQCEEVVISNKIVFKSGTLIYMINPDGSGIEKIAETGMDLPVLISPTGNEIVTFGWGPEWDEENAEIYIIDASGYPITKITDTESPFSNSQPSWSPDGEKILFSQQGNQTNTWYYDVVVINKDGTGKINLTDYESKDYRPNWSPDGSKIAFASHRDKGKSSIFTMDPDGSNTVQLTDSTNYDDFPVWSPDGSQIVYVSILNSIKGNEEIFVMDADGSNKTRLTNDSYEDSYPSWSPDGTKILFNRRVGNLWDIFIMNIDGTGLTNLTNTPDESELSPSWSPVQ